VTAVLRNNDAGIDHNLSFSAPGLDHGDTCTGPCTTTQTFTAPAPGRYDFFCTIHSTMVGAFIVDP
jgi:plastocyanin